MTFNSRICVIAELGNTHDGSLGQAKRLIAAACSAGCDAVKIQTHIFGCESLDDAPPPPYFKDETRRDYFKRVSFDSHQHAELKQFAENECGVEFMSSPFCEEAVDLLESIGIRRYKIPSGEITNLPLLKKVAATRKDVILSSGMSNEDELNQAVSLFDGTGCNLSILQCTSEYPCLPQNVGLAYIPYLLKRYNLAVGISDHTIGISAPLGAVALGASIVEKHFTLSRLMYGSDASMSTEPDEFKHMVSAIRELELMIDPSYSKNDVTNSLSNMKRVFEKSIVTARPIKMNTLISREDLTLKKPGTGIPASLLDVVVGKKALIDLDINHIIHFEEFK